MTIDYKLLTSNIVAGIIAVVSIFTLTGIIGEVKNPELFGAMLGAAISYLFTENVINGKSRKNAGV